MDRTPAVAIMSTGRATGLGTSPLTASIIMIRAPEDRTSHQRGRIPDALSELRVVTSNPTADIGRNSGATVLLVSKYGTNEFHGNAFWFYRTPRLNANEWASNFNRLGKRQFVQNIYGGSVGGPVWKNKTFFFVNIQRLALSKAVRPTALSTPLTPDADCCAMSRGAEIGRSERQALRSTPQATSCRAQTLPAITLLPMIHRGSAWIERLPTGSQRRRFRTTSPAETDSIRRITPGPRPRSNGSRTT